MRGTVTHTLTTAVLLVFLMVLGCSKQGAGGGTKMEIADLGLSMSIPAGWRIDKKNPRMCTQGDNTGLVIDEPLEGKAFSDYANQLCTAQGGKVRSKIPVKISRREAVLATIEYPDVGSAAVKVYIHEGDKLIEVSFVTAKEDFPAHESAFRQAIETIQLK